MQKFLDQAASEYPLHVEYTTISEFRSRGTEALSYKQNQRPSLWVIEPDETGVDVAALRWSLPGGACPVIVTFDAIDAQDVTTYAAEFALKQRTLVLLIAEQSVSGTPADEFPKLEIELMPAPNDEKPSGKIDFDSSGLDLSRLDKQPSDSGRTEWLVISYGPAVKPSQEAVNSARSEGQRVDHLMLNVLYPLPEAVLMRAMLGTQHIVVAEPNDGQYYLDIKREAPGIAVMHAGSASGVTYEHVLNRLKNSPRCC